MRAKFFPELLTCTAAPPATCAQDNMPAATDAGGAWSVLRAHGKALHSVLKAWDDDGNQYWYNETTGLSSWEDPATLW